MADSNVTIVGTLPRDPELRFTAGGKGVASFGVAVNRRYQVNGEWQERFRSSTSPPGTASARTPAASLSKGTRSCVTGRLEQREYETKEGEKRNVVESCRRARAEPRWADAEVERTQRTRPDGTPASSTVRPRQQQRWTPQ